MWQRDRRANRSVQRNVAPCVEPPPLIVYFGHSHAVAVGSCALLLRRIVVRPGIIVVDVWAVKPSKRTLQVRIVRSNPEAARCAVAARVDRGGRGQGARERRSRCRCGWVARRRVPNVEEKMRKVGYQSLFWVFFTWKPLKDVSLNNNHRRNDNQKTQSSSRYRLQSPQSMHSQNLTKAAEVGGRVTNLLAEDVSFTTPGRGGTLPSRSVCGGTPLIVSVALSRASASSSQSSKDFDLPATGVWHCLFAPPPKKNIWYAHLCLLQLLR